MSRLTRAESMQRTRAALLRVAEEVFADKGFADATLDDIADRAGLSRGVVYANFANRTELFPYCRRLASPGDREPVGTD
ncbi:TetR family transcriptional regulator [Nocardia salmonicida]